MLVREQSRNKGEFAIRQSLFQKGIGEELAAKALQPLSEERQLASARRLLEKNRWRFSGEDGRRNRARAFSFLARREIGRASCRERGEMRGLGGGGEREEV